MIRNVDGTLIFDETPESVTFGGFDGASHTIPWKKLPWIKCYCENGHVFYSRIVGRSLLEWAPNSKRICPKCRTQKWRIDLDFDYASAVFAQNQIDPDAQKLLAHIQEAIQQASSGDEEAALKTLESGATIVLPSVKGALKAGGWMAAIALMVSVLTSCNGETDVKIDVNYISQQFEFHATIEAPKLQIAPPRSKSGEKPNDDGMSTIKNQQNGVEKLKKRKKIIRGRKSSKLFSANR